MRVRHQSCIRLEGSWKDESCYATSYKIFINSCKAAVLVFVLEAKHLAVLIDQ